MPDIHQFLDFFDVFFCLWIYVKKMLQNGRINEMGSTNILQQHVKHLSHLHKMI